MTATLPVSFAVVTNPVYNTPDKATGEVLYAVDVVALGGEEGAEVWPIRIPGEPKGIRQGQPIRVSGLTAAPWSMDNRHGITFRASAIEPLAAPKAAAA